jgi:hypothetical protein
MVIFHILMSPFLILMNVCSSVIQLNFDVEVVAISDGPPPPPNYFAQIDLNGDGALDKAEIDAYFEKMGHPVPEELWASEDKNGDGKISWEEFSGPKGTEPPSAKEDL